MTVLTSTFFLTVLIAIGLFFFIRASVKDRIQQVTLLAEFSEDTLLTQLQQYFDQRAYRVKSLDREQDLVTFEGFVRPSLFLALFLTFLAAVGTLCLALILSVLFPQFQGLLLSLVLVAPIAGLFYWQKAGRVEQVALKLKNLDTATSSPKRLITITAHRDELAQFQKALGLEIFEAESAHSASMNV